MACEAWQRDRVDQGPAPDQDQSELPVLHAGLLRGRSSDASIVPNALRLSRGETGNVVLKGNAQLEYSRALQFLSPLGLTLDVAAADFAKATSFLNGKGSLLEAARLLRLHPRR